MCELGSCFKKSGQYSGSSAPLLTGFGIDLFNPYKVGMNVSLGFRQVSSEPEKIEAFYQVMLAHVHSESLTNPVFLSQCLGSESRDDVFDSVLPFLKRFCACLKVKYPSVHYKSYLDKLINSLDDSALDSGCRAKQVGVKLGLFFSSIKSGATAPLLSEGKNSALSVFSNYLILFPRDNSEKNKADFLDFLIETNFLRLGSAHHGLKSKFDDFPVFSDNVLLPGIKFLIDRNMIESPDERLKFFQLYWLLQSVSSNVSELDSACSKKADFKDQSSFKKWVGSYLSEKISPEKLADGFVSAAFLGSSSVSGGYLKPYVELKGDLISNTGKLSLKDFGNVLVGIASEYNEDYL